MIPRLMELPPRIWTLQAKGRGVGVGVVFGSPSPARQLSCCCEPVRNSVCEA